MTQFSFPWTCVPAGDGGTTSFNLEVVEAMQRLASNLNPASEGVIYWTDPDVLPNFTNPVGGTPEEDFFLNLDDSAADGTITIKAGVGMVQGWTFINDEDVTFTISGGNSNATDIIGLRKTLIGQTVRLFHGQGGVGTTYSLTQSIVTHEIALWELPLDVSGDYTAGDAVDVRKFVRTPLYPPQSASIAYPVSIGYDESGGVDIPLTVFGTSGLFGFGVTLEPPADEFDSGLRHALCLVTLPHDALGGEVDFQVIARDSYAPAATVYAVQLYLQNAISDANFDITTFVGVPTGFTHADFPKWSDIEGGNYAVLEPGQPYLFGVYLRGDLSDAPGNLVITGVQMFYNKQYAPGIYSDMPIQ